MRIAGTGVAGRPVRLNTWIWSGGKGGEKRRVGPLRGGGEVEEKRSKIVRDEENDEADEC